MYTYIEKEGMRANIAKYEQLLNQSANDREFFVLFLKCFYNFEIILK